MNWTKEQYEAYLAEYQQMLNKPVDDKPDDGPESVLQRKIRAYCTKRGYPHLSFRQSKKAKGFLTPGWPDETIALPGGRVVFIEDKSKTGGLSDNQKGTAIMLMALGHEWYEVRSYVHFLKIMEPKDQRIY